MSVIKHLEQTELFHGLTREQMERIAALGQEVTYNSSDVIVRKGDVADRIFVVCRGMVEVDISQDVPPEMREQSQFTYFARLGEGQIFGEMGLMVRGTRSATVRCVQDSTTVFAVPRQAFWTMCDSDHHIGYIVMCNIAADLSRKLYLSNLRV